MRITNKIMQNNSLYNINNNKITEDQLNTMMSTGKKLTRPSDDPVIAIRALRLRSNVTQLSQYYEKNAKDAESWLDVTADSLSTITAVLTDTVKQATKGANMDLTLDDLSTIITQMDALQKEYYSTGNVDYAGRYIFTGYRTDTSLTFETTDTCDYVGINDEFKASSISTSSRVVGLSKLDSEAILNSSTSPIVESDIVEKTVGRLRLSYSNLNYLANDSKTPELKWREQLVQPATSTVDETARVFNLSYKTKAGDSHFISLPMLDDNESGEEYTITSEDIIYTVKKNGLGDTEITAQDSGEKYSFYVDKNGIYQESKQSLNVAEGSVNIETVQKTTVTYTNDNSEQIKFKLPLLQAIGQSYTINIRYKDHDAVAVVNSDGTYTLTDSDSTTNADGTTSKNIVNITANGSIYSSYKETSLTIDAKHMIYATSEETDIDEAYRDLDNNETGKIAYFNAVTGEILLNKELKEKLSTLPDVLNANSIDVVYDKKEWKSGEIRPENLFNCTLNSTDGQKILFNKGSAAHDINYDIGFAQSVVVNTTADSLFTTDVRRDVDDLSSLLSGLQQVNSTIKILKEKLAATNDKEEQTKIKAEINAAQKAFDYRRSTLQKEFERKITSLQKALDTANIAVTENGTRSKRLDLVNTRLMGQTTTFKTLQSENEDIDLAETVTQLTSAKVTYEASLMATGKISQTSLMNYI